MRGRDVGEENLGRIVVRQNIPTIIRWGRVIIVVVGVELRPELFRRG